MTAQTVPGGSETSDLFGSLLAGTMHGVDRLASVIELLGLAVLVYGVVRASIAFVRERGGPMDGTGDFAAIRISLGFHILLALEILICADIMHSVVRRSLEDLIGLSAVVIIRTIIAFFLNRELREARESRSHPGPAGEDAS